MRFGVGFIGLDRCAELLFCVGQLALQRVHMSECVPRLLVGRIQLDGLLERDEGLLAISWEAGDTLLVMPLRFLHHFFVGRTPAQHTDESYTYRQARLPPEPSIASGH